MRAARFERLVLFNQPEDNPSHFLLFENHPTSMTVHIPVLLSEAIEGLCLQPGQIIVDGTLGGGGHSIAFAQQVGERGKVIGLDRDPSAVARIADLLPNNVVPVCSNYADTPEVLKELEIEQVDAIFLDLGLSSDQLADEQRGFSFQSDGPFDLRFDQTQGEPAWRLVENMKEKNLADLIYEYGEERYSRKIARKIVEVRHKQSLKSTAELAALLRGCVPKSRKNPIDPATRTFQAFRIAVNEELKWLRVALKRLPQCLKPGGRIGIISFHSLEDRMVKHALREDDRLDVLTKKPITASEAELHENPRSRSAKMRFARRKSD